MFTRILQKLMSKFSHSTCRRRTIAWLTMCCLAAGSTLSASADNAQNPVADPAKELRADLVKTGLYVIRGGGANTLFRFTANGLILVDGKLPGQYRGLMSQVRKINKLSDLPVRVLVVTNDRDAHSGNINEFLAAGVAVVIQQNAKSRLPAYLPPDNGKALAPLVVYDREQVLNLGGVEVQLKHFGRARTDADTVVYFVGQKTVAVGDLYTLGAPEPDFAAGGSLRHWSEALAHVLKLDFDTVVPSDGPPVPRAALEMFKARIDAAVSRASALVEQGVPKSEFMAQWKTDDLGWKFGFAGAQLEAFIDDVSQTR